MAKTLLSVVAVRPEGGLVLRGVYAFYETHGLPLDVLFALMWDRNALPDWADLVLSMVKAGRQADRAFGAVRAAIDDACCYPTDFKKELHRRLNLLERSWVEYRKGHLNDA